MEKYSKYREKKQGISLTSSEDLAKVSRFLGDGPAQFAPRKPERDIQEQLDALKDQERECVDALIDKWDGKYPGYPLPDSLVLRYARNSPGNEAFNKKAAWQTTKAMHGSDVVQSYLSLGATKMSKQLETKTLFPLSPQLKTLAGHEVFYMKPARYCPSETPSRTIINNLAYCMNSMYEKEEICSKGICFMANMNDWTMKHFGTKYCLKFMNMLQGHTLPVRVNLFLIVNPPSWFNKVWTVMKGMLSEEFAQKVHMIPESELSEHLMDGYQAYLPNDMATGTVDTDELVMDYIQYRVLLEMGHVPIRLNLRKPPTKNAEKKLGAATGKKRKGLKYRFGGTKKQETASKPIPAM